MLIFSLLHVYGFSSKTMLYLKKITFFRIFWLYDFFFLSYIVFPLFEYKLGAEVQFYMKMEFSIYI